MMRNNYIQSVRGIAIIAVVFIHIPIINDPNFQSYHLFFRQLVNFAVPIFFFLSGYFIKKENNFIDRLKRLIIPYIFWSLAYIGLNLFMNYYTFTPKQIFSIIFLGGAIPHLYFLSVLIQMTIITPFLLKLFEKKPNLLLTSLLLTPIYLLLIQVFYFHFNSMPPFYYSIFPAWFSYYFLGFYVSKNIEKIKITLKKYSFVTFSLLLLVLIFAAFYSINSFNSTQDLTYSVTQVSFSTFLYALSLISIILMLWPNENEKKSIFSVIGDYSFGIYCIHGFVLVLFNYILNLIYWPVFLFVFKQMFSVGLTIAGSYVLLLFAEKKLGSKYSKQIGIK